MLCLFYLLLICLHALEKASLGLAQEAGWSFRRLVVQSPAPLVCSQACWSISGHETEPQAAPDAAIGVYMC